MIRLRDGRHLDRVYVMSERPYFKTWGIYPSDDPGKAEVPIEDVIEIIESPTRLPPKFADQLYKVGESGMGYTIFTVVFSDGSRMACLTGNAVDFIKYPDGKMPSDVTSVLPHVGRENAERQPDYCWCIFSE